VAEQSTEVVKEGKRTGEYRIFTLPNLISFIRLLLIPAFFVAYVAFDNVPLGVVLFVIAACTDWIDGLVARKTNTVTRVGQVLDPLVDRFLLIFGVIAVFVVGRIPLWVMVLVFSRDIVLGVLTLKINEDTGEPLGVVFVGKVATAFMMTSFAMLILNWPSVPGLGLFEISWLPGFGSGTFCLGIFLAYIGVVLQWITAVIYLYRWIRYGTTSADHIPPAPHDRTDAE
jgi:cardiolipin synthase